MAFLVSLDQTSWRVLRCLCDPRPPASHITLAETKILSHFSLQILHIYIFQPIMPERIEHEGQYSNTTQILQQAPWSAPNLNMSTFCWVFTETLKFQHVFASPLLLSKAWWPCFQRRMRLSINVEYSKISPSWGRARIIKPWCHSNLNDPLDLRQLTLLGSFPPSPFLSTFP